MMQLMKQIIRHTPLYRPLCNWRAKRLKIKEVAEWQRNGRPVPPPHLVKQRIVLSYARSYGLKVLVETGTYYGDMVDAMKANFDHIYSIELGEDLYKKAKERFRKDGNVELIWGDSGRELEKLLTLLDRPALFWLDGHYSAGVTSRGEKDTPIYEELGHILSAPDRGHVVLVDDARCFGEEPEYPTLDQLRDFILSKRDNVKISVEDDIIRITPIL